MIWLINLPFNIPFNLSSFVKILIWGSVISIVIAMLVIFIRNKLKYVYYGIVLRRRQESIDGIPQAVILHGKAGYFSKKTGKVIYRIKYGKMPWHIIETSDTPDPNKMLGNLALFEQLDKDNVLQVGLEVDWEGTTKKMKLIPVKDDLKFHHRLHMQEVDAILETRKVSPVVIGMVIMGLIIVAGIIVFYFLNQAGGG